MSPPPAATVAQVRAALDALAEFMNAIGEHFGEAQTAYPMFGMMGAGPKELVAMLRTAEQHIELQKAGKTSWHDPALRKPD